MKISNKLLVALATTLATFTFTFPVHAEWRIGTQFGYNKSEIEVNGDFTADSKKEKNGNSFDVFGQWRTEINEDTYVGVHIGYGQNGTEYEDSAMGSVDLQDLGISNTEDVGEVSLKYETKQGKTLDLLGVVAWKRGDLTPFVMFGYTTVELDSKYNYTGSGFTDTDFNGSLSDKDDDTLKGFKLVGGVEGEFSQNWLWHAALEYVDYGDGKFTYPAVDAGEDEIELDHTGLRFGIAYTF